MVKLWNQALQPISVFDVTPYSCVDASVASLDIRPVDPQSSGALTLLVGTYGGEIMEVSSGKGESGGRKGADGSCGDPRNLDLSHASATVLQHSHYSGELWGLAAHPVDPNVFATVDDDKTLRIWSIKRNSMLNAVPLYWPARYVAAPSSWPVSDHCFSTYNIVNIQNTNKNYKLSSDQSRLSC